PVRVSRAAPAFVSPPVPPTAPETVTSTFTVSVLTPRRLRFPARVSGWLLGAAVPPRLTPAEPFRMTGVVSVTPPGWSVWSVPLTRVRGPGPRPAGFLTVRVPPPRTVPPAWSLVLARTRFPPPTLLRPPGPVSGPVSVVVLATFSTLS